MRAAHATRRAAVMPAGAWTWGGAGTDRFLAVKTKDGCACDDATKTDPLLFHPPTAAGRPAARPTPAAAPTRRLHRAPTPAAPRPRPITIPHSAPLDFPQSVENKFHPGHAAAIALSCLKWVLATFAIVAVVDPARALAETYLPIAANWGVPLARVMGSILVSVSSAVGALQLYTEAGLAASPPAEALTLGLLAGAAFRGLHLMLNRAFFLPSFWTFDAALVGAAVALLAWRYTSIAAARGDGVPSAATGLAPLLPGKTPLATALGVVGLLFSILGIAMVAAPPTLGDAILAAPLGPVGASMRVAIGTGLLFPTVFTAWVLKDAADRGPRALRWPPVRALAWGLLIASAARVVAVVSAFNGGVFAAGGMWAVPVAVHSAVGAVALAALAAGR